MAGPTKLTKKEQELWESLIDKRMRDFAVKNPNFSSDQYIEELKKYPVGIPTEEERQTAIPMSGDELDRQLRARGLNLTPASSTGKPEMAIGQPSRVQQNSGVIKDMINDAWQAKLSQLRKLKNYYGPRGYKKLVELEKAKFMQDKMGLVPDDEPTEEERQTAIPMSGDDLDKEYRIEVRRDKQRQLASPNRERNAALLKKLEELNLFDEPSGAGIVPQEDPEPQQLAYDPDGEDAAKPQMASMGGNVWRSSMPIDVDEKLKAKEKTKPKYDLEYYNTERKKLLDKKKKTWSVGGRVFTPDSADIAKIDSKLKVLDRGAARKGFKLKSDESEYDDTELRQPTVEKEYTPGGQPQPQPQPQQVQVSIPSLDKYRQRLQDLMRQEEERLAPMGAQAGEELKRYQQYNKQYKEAIDKLQEMQVDPESIWNRMSNTQAIIMGIAQGLQSMSNFLAGTPDAPNYVARMLQQAQARDLKKQELLYKKHVESMNLTGAERERAYKNWAGLENQLRMGMAFTNKLKLLDLEALHPASGLALKEAAWKSMGLGMPGVKPGKPLTQGTIEKLSGAFGSIREMQQMIASYKGGQGLPNYILGKLTSKIPGSDAEKYEVWRKAFGIKLAVATQGSRPTDLDAKTITNLLPQWGHPNFKERLQKQLNNAVRMLIDHRNFLAQNNQDTSTVDRFLSTMRSGSAQRSQPRITKKKSP